MGVNIYLLDRRRVRLSVAGVVQSVGAVRPSWKITELDEERVAEVRASEEAVAAMPSPKAAMVADIFELPLGTKSGKEVRAHLVIGWDEGRTSVSDMNGTTSPSSAMPSAPRTTTHSCCTRNVTAFCITLTTSVRLSSA